MTHGTSLGTLLGQVLYNIDLYQCHDVTSNYRLFADAYIRYKYVNNSDDAEDLHSDRKKTVERYATRPMFRYAISPVRELITSLSETT